MILKPVFRLKNREGKPVMDNLTPAQRSHCMASVRGKNTTPEMVVRRLVYSLGHRYRLHLRSLPGNPDLVFSSKRKVIFVHGCFWHMHNCPKGRVAPLNNAGYWTAKRHANVRRDRNNIRRLKAEGWKVLVVWECWTRDQALYQKRLGQFLSV